MNRKEASLKGCAASNRSRSIERAEGLAFARKWRAANKPYFDALYGPEKAA
jgi:hypothetical protein